MNEDIVNACQTLVIATRHHQSAIVDVIKDHYGCGDNKDDLALQMAAFVELLQAIEAAASAG